jgi:hypothetical protein
MFLQQLKPSFPGAAQLYPFALGLTRSNNRNVPARASRTASEVGSASYPVLAIFIRSVSTKCSQWLALRLEYYPRILRAMQ